MTCLPLQHSDARVTVLAAEELALFFDFDGTLTPLVDDPSEARLSGEARQVLGAISRRTGTVTTIISGRALADLRSRIDIDDLIYVGNHGLEICGRGLFHVDQTAWDLRETLRAMCERIAAELAPIPGCFVEFKGLTASVHYRSTPDDYLLAIAEIVGAEQGRQDHRFSVRKGHEVLEITPSTHWNKGMAVCFITERLNNQRALTVYFGDDATDEDAFKALHDSITVKVGDPDRSAARYYVPEPSDVLEFLRAII